ncbi:MAG: hypothetical protein A2583_06545 [Bdellovibrionales bacterium RIFOXYD1_FULL_53_11]|nr:MAG: hypothetical protein A2583_06545 [Bdellovibrionales bacterium RIFOXYD1_FULL_53_11]
MIFWMCGGVAMAAALLAMFAPGMRLVAMALWCVGAAVAGIFLVLGAEFLAIIQVIISTMVALSHVFYSSTFGEYEKEDTRTPGNRVVSLILPAAAGAGLSASLWFGLRQLPGMDAMMMPEGALKADQSLARIGKALAEDHSLGLEVLAVSLFVVIIGAGVAGRREVKDK